MSPVLRDSEPRLAGCEGSLASSGLASSPLGAAKEQAGGAQARAAASLHWRVRLALALLLLSLLGFLAATYWQFQTLNQVVDATDRRKAARQLMLETERVLSSVKDLDTGWRGFLLTGDERFLEPFFAARQRLDVLMPKQRMHLMREYGGVASMLETIERGVQRRIQQMDDSILRLRAHGARRPAAVDLAEMQSAKQAMDDLRAEFARLTAAQAAYVEQRDREVARLLSQARTAFWLLPLLASVTAAVGMVLLWIERRRRQWAEQRLKLANEQLEARVAERTHELAQALERIETFAYELDAGIEAERRRIAREVHDQIGQVLTALKMRLGASHGGAGPAPLDASEAAQLLHWIDEALNVARRIGSELRPPLLDDLGLAAAIEYYVESLDLRDGPSVSIDIRDEERLTAAQRNQLFRITQEALTNALRHAQATALQVEGHAQAAGYEYCFSDNGRGPGDVPREGAMGLLNMRERAKLVGGQFEFGPNLLRGSRVMVRLPASVLQSSPVTAPGDHADADAEKAGP